MTFQSVGGEEEEEGEASGMLLFSFDIREYFLNGTRVEGEDVGQNTNIVRYLFAN